MEGVHMSPAGGVSAASHRPEPAQPTPDSTHFRPAQAFERAAVVAYHTCFASEQRGRRLFLAATFAL